MRNSWARKVVARLSVVFVMVALLTVGVHVARAQDVAEPDTALAQAAGLYKAGNYAAAADVYRGFIEKYPASPARGEASYWLGESLYHLQQYDGAADAYEQALTLGVGDETAMYARYSIARARLEAGHAEAASSALETFIEKYPASELTAECTYLLATLMADSHSYERAISLFAGVTSGFPQSQFASPARLGLASAYQAAGQLKAARDVFNQIAASASPDASVARLSVAECTFLLGEYSAAANDYAAIGPGAEEYSRAQYGLALTYQALKRDDEAQAIYLKLTQSPVDASIASRAQLRLAEQAYARQDYDAARERFNDAAGLASEGIVRDEAALGLLMVSAAIQPTQRDATAAEEIARRHTSDALGPQALYRAGAICHASGRLEDAARLLQASADAGLHSPSTPDALVLLADTDLRLGDTGAAQQLWERVIHDYPDNPAAAAAYSAMAGNYARLGQTDAAFQTATAFASAFPQDRLLPPALLDVAGTLYREKQFDQARQLCEETLRADPSSAASRYQISLISLAQGTLGEAWQQLIQAEAGSPAEALATLLPPAELKVAEAQFASERYPEAASSYSHILEKYPQASEAQAARYKLAWSQLKLQQTQPALDNFLAAVQSCQDPQMVADARYQASDLLLARGDAAGAFDMLAPFMNGLTDSPVRRDALGLAGRAALKLEKYDVARQAFSAAIEGLGDDTVPLTALAGLATAQERLGQFTDVVATLQRALPLASGDIALQMHLQLARCYLSLQQPLLAAQEYDTIGGSADGETAASALFEAGRIYQQQGQLEAARIRYTKIVDKFAQIQPYGQQAKSRLGELRQ